MSFPLFHDPLQGAVTVDAPVRDPQIHRQNRLNNRPSRSASHRPEQSRNLRQREVAGVAEDLRALMEQAAIKR